MADIICPKCKHSFDNNSAEANVTRAAAATAGGVTGGIIGAEMGIVGGPIGSANGWWMGAIFGATTGWLAADQFRRCPKCGHIFKT